MVLAWLPETLTNPSTLTQRVKVGVAMHITPELEMELQTAIRL